MAAKPLRDAQARASALDTTRSFIVQAPAGSGKTGLLTQRFLRLLAQVTRPEEVLAITFTRKAAAEMRWRILQALQQARDDAQPDDDYEASVIHDARAALEQDQRQGWSLIETPARLQIMTLDALNSRLVSAMPVTAGVARVRIVESEEQARLYDDAAAALLDWLATQESSGNAARQFLSHLDAGGFAWRRHITSMLARRDQWLGVLLGAQANRQDLRAASERALRALVESSVRRVDGLFPSAEREALLAILQRVDARRADAGAAPPEALPVAWPTPDEQALPFWRRLAATLLTAKGTWRKTVTVRDGFPAKPEAAKLDKEVFLNLVTRIAGESLAEALADIAALPDPVYDDAQWRIVEALLQLLPLAAAELERLMAGRGVADYTALAARAVAALGSIDSGQATDLALRLDYQVHHILVDEMQDTAPSQYRLLEGLTAGWEPGDGRTLFCVGDPMQSIYRFRGADVSLFLEAWEHGIGSVSMARLLLSTNFRSETGIIEWVNSVFPTVLGDRNDALTDAVRYAAADVGPKAGQGGQVHWHTGIDEAIPDAGDVVTEVARILAAHPEESIGILARTRGALEPILEGLRAADIACEALDIDRLTELPEIIDLVNLTRALEHPMDRLSWFGLLRSPLLGWTLEDIDQFVALADQEGTGLPVPELLSRPEYTEHLAAETRALTEACMGDYDASRQAAPVSTLRDRVERFWCALGGPAALSSADAAEQVWRFLDTVSRLEQAGQLDSLPGLVPALDALRVTRHAEAPRVFAMTIFKSKGLEFDHVIIPALQATTQRSQKPALLFDLRAQDGRNSILFSTVSDRVTDGGDALHDLLWRREQIRSRHELDRLLYVATTRARRSLHLFGGARRNKDGQLSRLSVDSLFGRFGDVALRALEEAPDRRDDRESTVAGETEAGMLPMTTRRIARVWQRPPLPAPDTDTRFVGQPATDPVEFDWAGSGARHVGTVVHAWLHGLAGSGDPASHLGDRAQVAAQSRRLLAELGVAESDLDGHVARVIDALDGATQSKDAGWLIGAAGPEDRAEFALGAVVEGTVSRLVIDRVVRDSNGTLWIVDYKTSRHEGGDLEGFFANECRRYRSQLEGYARAVTAWYAHREQALGPLRLGLYFTQYGRLMPLPESD
ncbi:MAG: UvrD-helicase domain-containing protein [Pseudomonadota bacterium]